MYNRSDLEDILSQIRVLVIRYKENKHEMKLLEIQDVREDLAILRMQLSDIGADLYGFKIETAAAYEKARYTREEEVENHLRGLKDRKESANAADRAKRTARLETPTDEMIQADKMHKLAYNLYAISLQDILNSIASRISILSRDGLADRSAKDLGHVEPDSFGMAIDQIALKQVTDLKYEINSGLEQD